MAVMLSAGLRARVALDKYGFRTTHSLGQNFLLDDRLLNGLLDEAEVCAGENVLEIGPGAGVMTALLCERGCRVLAVELDERLRPVLADVLAPWPEVRVEFADFMRVDLETLISSAFGDEPYSVIANLPYYITADILERLTASGRAPRRIGIMVQKEAADRLMSEPGEKQWCALAADMRLYGTARVLTEVPPDCFEPAPHVMSAFIELRAWEERPWPVADPDMVRRVIRTAFAMRRKTLANNLKAGFSMKQERVAEVLETAGLDLKVRGEALSMEQLCRLAEVLRNS